jgi:hypothetical protein
MKLNILLTFDHELPLGGVRSDWEEALFEPTQRLFRLSENIEVPVTLFTDVLCAIRFRDWDYEGFYKPNMNQLKEALTLHHDVQLHLHPHWLTSSYKDKRFIPSGDFSLSDFAGTDKTQNIESIVDLGAEFLNTNLKQEFPDYRCNAFRAGGYNLGNRDDRGRIFKALYNNGILYDSSISKGYYFKSGISEVDFRGMPSLPNWYLNFNGNLASTAEQGIIEIPIASIPKSVFEVPTSFKIKKYAFRAPQNRGYQIHEGKPGGYRHKFVQLFSSRMLGFDNFTYSHQYLMKILDYNVRKYKDYKEVFLSVSGHPKSMGDYSFELMKNFVENVRKKYPDASFTTFSKLSGQLG